MFVRCLIVLGLVAVVAVVARPVAHVIKGWQARRLAGEATILLEQQKWPEAAKKIHAAFQLRSTEPEVGHAVAQLLSRTGQGGAALEWWQKIAQSRGLSISDRRDYATAALSANELFLASEQVDLLLAQKSGAAPADLLLAAQLFTLRGHSSSAVDYAERVLHNSGTTLREMLGAAVLILLNTTPQSPSYANAVDRLIDLARGEKTPTSLQALKLLGSDPPRPRMTEPGPAPLTIVAPPNHRNVILPKEVADRLENHPNARAADRLLALDIRAHDEPARREEYTRQAIESYRYGDDDTLAALGAWLYERGQFDTLLEVIPMERAERRRELYFERVDALNALGRFSELKEMLLPENSTLDQTFQHIFLAIVSGKLGETVASTNEWQRAVETANTTQRLLQLAQHAEANGAPEIADAAYAEVLSKQPHLRSAYVARLHLAEAMGQTATAQKIAAEIVQLWPEDVATHIREIYFRLLLGVSPVEAAAVERELEEYSAHNPLGWNARSALALAHLRTGHATTALTASDGPAAGATPPSAMAVRATALAANGWKDKAREQAQKLTTAKLLPEERTLIAPLLGKE